MRPDDVAVERDLPIVYGHIGDAMGNPFLISLGDYRGAVEWYAEAAKIARRMTAADASGQTGAHRSWDRPHEDRGGADSCGRLSRRHCRTWMARCRSWNR